MAAVAGCLLAGGSLPSTETLFGQHELAAVGRAAGDVPRHLESTPSGAAVRIDGTRRGKTPLDTWLSPGQHALSLHPDTLDDDQALPVAQTGAHVEVALWRRRPEVVALRPVYPGASLVDSRFLDGGQVALLAGLLVTGYNIMVRPYLGSTYAGVAEFLPRLLLGGILINTADWWCRLAIDVNNAMCGAFGAPTIADMVSGILAIADVTIG